MSVTATTGLLSVIREGDVIDPAFRDKDVPIVLSSSDYYAPFCGVTIRSILDHMSSEYNYDLFILTADMGREQQALLREMTMGVENVSLRLVDMEETAKNNFFTYTHIRKETYFRLMLPWLFPRFSSMIFLDSDMIVRTDIAKLQDIPLKDYYFAAVPDVVMAGFVNGYQPWWNSYLRDKLDLDDPYGYVNAGLIVFNCDKMRKSFSAQELLADATEHEYVILDQDVLNRRCKKQILKLDIAWNMPPDCLSQQFTVRKSAYIACAPEEIRRKYEAAHKHPFVIHYTDEGKPWFFPDEDLADVFWETAQRTPFYEAIVFRMLNFQAIRKAEQYAPYVKSVQYYPQGSLFKRTVKRIVRIFLPYGTRRRAVIKRFYFKLRGWSI